MAARTRRSKRTVGDVSPLTPAQHRALARLSQAHLLDELYLAGGVGVALYLHHRRSVDLDFFSRSHDLDLERIADRLGARSHTVRSRSRQRSTTTRGSSAVRVRTSITSSDLSRGSRTPSATAFCREE
jgi:hypothetical protein